MCNGDNDPTYDSSITNMIFKSQLHQRCSDWFLYHLTPFPLDMLYDGIPAEIPTSYLQNINLDHFHYSDLIGLWARYAGRIVKAPIQLGRKHF
jgi:hypothetical protein